MVNVRFAPEADMFSVENLCLLLAQSSCWTKSQKSKAYRLRGDPRGLAHPGNLSSWNEAPRAWKQTWTYRCSVQAATSPRGIFRSQRDSSCGRPAKLLGIAERCSNDICERQLAGLGAGPAVSLNPCLELKQNGLNCYLCSYLNPKSYVVVNYLTNSLKMNGGPGRRGS